MRNMCEKNLYSGNTEVGALVDILRQRIERGYPTLFQTAGSKSSYAAVRIFHNANVRENRRFVVNLSKEEVCALQKNLGRSSYSLSPLPPYTPSSNIAPK